MSTSFTDITGAADAREDATDSGGYDTDVFIVGTGPTGATTALALATYGVRTMMISQWSWLANTPRAHITNQRAAEVLRDLGIEEEVQKYAVPWEQMGDTLFATSLTGPEIARLQTWGTGDQTAGEYSQHSPSTMLDVPQTYLEPILVKNAAERGARVAFSTKYLGHTQDQDGVTVNLLNRVSGQEYSMRTRYLVGADGAKSQIADEINLNLVGRTARAGTLYTRFKADLSQHVAHRPSILHWFLNPAASFGEIGMGLLRAIRPWDEWIAGWGYDMAGGEPEQSEEYVTDQIRTLVGDPALKIELQGSSPWFVNQQYATTMSSGRVFCGGDATHRHPPSSGLGSNTCIQDAFNLAWKLAYAVRGWAGEQLLESYSDERVPVGAQIVARANQSRLDYAPLRECFDTRGPDGTRHVDYGLERLNAPTLEGEQLREKLQAALELKNDEFNALGVETNQRYESSAVLGDPTLGEEVFVHDAVRHAQPTTRPGAKIPHAWLVGPEGRRISTLDLVGKGRFTLITGISGTAWAEAVHALDLPYLDVLQVGTNGIRDPYLYWTRTREVAEAGALLIRPDAVVAWRQPEPVREVVQARHELESALHAILASSNAAFIS